MNAERKLEFNIVLAFVIVQATVFGINYLLAHSPSQPIHQLAKSLPTPYSYTPSYEVHMAIFYLAEIVVFGLVVYLAHKFKPKILERLMAWIKNVRVLVLLRQFYKKYRIVSLPIMLLVIGLFVYTLHIPATIITGLLLFGAGFGILIWLTQKHLQIAGIVLSIFFGLVLGDIFRFEIAALFFIGIAIYDFVAVFITKHMLVIAQKAIKMGFGVYMASAIYGVEKAPLEDKAGNVILKGRNNTYSYAPINTNWAKAAAKKIREKGEIPIAIMKGLGWGDLVIPAMLITSAFFYNQTLSIFLLGGSVLGILITMEISNKLQRSLPAIPTIGSGMLIAYLLYMIV